MAQLQSSRQSNVRRRRVRSGVVEVTLEEASDQGAGERLRRAYEMILLAGERHEKEARTMSADAREEL
jgi:hypothetical protein